MATLPPVYDPKEVEARWYAKWESSGLFRPSDDPLKKPFTIVIPPPNVTGILHMGHALNNTLQDVLIRWKRMQGHAALWVPGTDHAGIATQNVVERQLAKEKETRHGLGREKFVKRVWKWREEYGSTIVKQLRRLGSSCDWSRERFTMDEGLSKAVETAFLKLYEEGLIYRGHYMVNWCPRCQTALSDEEVIHEEIKGHLWHIRYPSRDGGTGIVVATTRPETMLGDVAVAVHPEDPRYQSLVGETVILPLVNRPIPVIADKEVKLEFGTGAVKITPAHDPIDFEMARRHPEIVGLSTSDRFSIPLNLFVLNMLDPDVKMMNVPERYKGLGRFECRKQVIEDLGKSLVKTEDYKHSVGHCYRCRTIIEPHLSPQWFVKMKPLAELGIEAVEKDGIRFIPERWNKVYLDWLNNIRDWCISRQIWWGHRIPVWVHTACNRPEFEGHGEWKGGRYIEPGMVIMSAEEFAKNPPACPTCGEKDDWLRDEDVLDTWFSSWLWPFSTLGWPDEKAPDLKRFYPTSVLVTAQDIIFFWVARMVMAGKFFMKEIPFRDVYIHGIIRVEGGKKMSKSLGNIIDPLEIIKKMGADALRFSIAHMTSEGQDLYLSEGKFLLGRNFANKLWNASRLILEKSSVPEGQTIAFNPKFMTVPDRWIMSRFQDLVKEITASLEGYRFNEAAKRLYHFVWHDFCDWYLEIAKLQRESGDVAIVHNTDHILLTVLEGTLRLLHPFMPFLTEELWHRTAEADSEATLMTASWPELEQAWVDPEAEELFARLQAVVTEVRNIRSTFRVPVKQPVTLILRGARGTELVAQHEKLIQRLGSLSSIAIDAKAKRPAGAVAAHLSSSALFDAWDLIVPLAELVDLSVERGRIQKEMEGLESRAKAKRSRLQDGSFRANAPVDIVAEEEESLKELEAELAKWSESLKQIQ